MTGKSASLPWVSALWSLAQERSCAQQWYDQLGILEEFFATPEIRRVLGPRPSRQRAVELCRKILGDLVSPELLSLVAQLADTKRLKLLGDIRSGFGASMLAAHGERVLELRTAKSLDGAHLEQLKGLLEKKFETRLSIHTVQDETLLGGFVASLGDKVLDASLRARRDQLAHDLLRD